MIRALVLLVLLQMPMGGITGHHPIIVPMTLDSHNQTSGSVTATTSTTVVITPTAGDAITCEIGTFYANAVSALTSVSDNVNAGSYAQAVTWAYNSTAQEWSGIFYKTGVAAGSTTITFLSSATNQFTGLSCQSWKPASTPATFTLDAAGTQRTIQTGVVANPTTGSAVTPANGNELVLAQLYTANNTPSGIGASFTAVDTTTVLSFPMYWIQTTATATNAPYTMTADAQGWTDQQAAFYFLH